MVKMIRHVILRHVNLGILEAILMVVQENIDEEHKNEEDDDYIDSPSKKKDIIESKLQE